jgi:hypothetical protein
MEGYRMDVNLQRDLLHWIVVDLRDSALRCPRQVQRRNGSCQQAFENPLSL